MIERKERTDDGVVVEAVLGPVLITALATRDVFCLHASAVTLGDGAVLFIGESGEGKSTLARCLPASGSGITRVTDDISPVRGRAGRFEVLPDFPQLKLPAVEQTAWRKWPGGLAANAIYRLNRHEPGGAGDRGPSRSRLGPAESFSMLTGQGVASRLFTDELLRRHARWTAGLVEKVPVYELTYPAGEEFFPAIREFLIAAV